VKLGDLTSAVRALGVLTKPNTVELRVAEPQMKDVKLGQAVAIALRGGQESFTGVVTRIPGGAIDGTVAVDVHLPGTHPAQGGAEANGTIEIERPTDVLPAGRPVMGQPGSEGALYKLEPDGRQAVRLKVQFGKISVNAIEIRSGLQPGDKVILSDTTAFHALDRVNLKRDRPCAFRGLSFRCQRQVYRRHNAIVCPTNPKAGEFVLAACVTQLHGGRTGIQAVELGASFHQHVHGRPGGRADHKEGFVSIVFGAGDGAIAGR
jgi:hypothetical protein